MSGLSVEPVETGCDLRIATLPKAHVQSAMFSLLSLLFFNDKEEGRFVSVTCVQQMITLVADASSLSLVPGLEVDPTAWSVLRVDSVLDVVGAIASLTRPLARAGIPVFHLSTYDSEFVLVPRAHLHVALSCFSSDPSRSPPLMGDDRSSGELDSVSAPRERAFALNILDSHRTTILRLERQYEPWHLHALLRLLFFSEPEDPEPAVVNLTWSPDNELSILAGESVCPSRTACTPPAFLACFDHDCRSDAMVDGALQHVPCWALRHPAGGLATDFTLVPLSKLEEATQAFESAGFRVATGLESQLLSSVSEMQPEDGCLKDVEDLLLSLLVNVPSIVSYRNSAYGSTCSTKSSSRSPLLLSEKNPADYIAGKFPSLRKAAEDRGLNFKQHV
ncbi:MAG: hypothetical protein SGPRY_000027 [Prymnesium sp.]